MAQAASLAARLPRQLSFKRTVQLWLVWEHSPAACDDDDMLRDLFALIAQQQVGQRPGRIEPRALKRRAKAYPLLTTPRAIARAYVSEHGHPKKLN